MQYTVIDGKEIGVVLTPHLQDGHYIVSASRFKKDYIPLKTLDEVRAYISKGFKLRMSNQSSKFHKAASLISPSSIKL